MCYIPHIQILTVGIGGKKLQIRQQKTQTFPGATMFNLIYTTTLTRRAKVQVGLVKSITKRKELNLAGRTTVVLTQVDIRASQHCRLDLRFAYNLLHNCIDFRARPTYEKVND